MAIGRPMLGDAAAQSILKSCFAAKRETAGKRHCVSHTNARSPHGMSEGDVVPLGPPRKHLLLRDKAVVVASSTALVLYVRDTFIGSPGLVVVIGHLLGSRLLPGRKSVVTR